MPWFKSKSVQIYCKIRFSERILKDSSFVYKIRIRNPNWSVFFLQRGDKMTWEEVTSITKQADFNCNGKLDYNKVIFVLVLLTIMSISDDLTPGFWILDWINSPQRFVHKYGFMGGKLVRTLCEKSIFQHVESEELKVKLIFYSIFGPPYWIMAAFYCDPWMVVVINEN